MRVLAPVPVLLLLGAVGAASPGPPLTNEELISMARGGISGAAIVARIDASTTDFRLDAASLGDLVSAGVPDPVIRAMFTRQNADVGGGGPDWREAEPRRVWAEILRVSGRGRAAGKAVLLEGGFQFLVTDESGCTDAGMGFGVGWGQMAAVCFRYAFTEDSATGTIIVLTKPGSSYQIRGSRSAVQDIEREFKSRQARLEVRCD